MSLEAKLEPLLSWDFGRLSEVLNVEGFDEIPSLIIAFEKDVRWLFEIVESVELLAVESIVLAIEPLPPMGTWSVSGGLWLE